MLKALKEQNRIIAGNSRGGTKAIKASVTSKDLIKPFVEIDPYYESNKIGKNVWEYMINGSSAFKKILEYLDNEGIYYTITQDDRRSSTKIFEIDFDEQ